MTPKKVYFYEEDGLKKKYLYCSRCGGGPFKEFDSTIHRCGEHIVICEGCGLVLKLKKQEFTISRFVKQLEPEKPKSIEELIIKPVMPEPAEELKSGSA
jgi:uncharacterized Zn finger protein